MNVNARCKAVTGTTNRVFSGCKLTNQNLNDLSTKLRRKRLQSSKRIPENRNRVVIYQLSTELQERPTKESKEKFKYRPTCYRKGQAMPMLASNNLKRNEHIMANRKQQTRKQTPEE
jgi:hypothetical protein